MDTIVRGAADFVVQHAVGSAVVDHKIVWDQPMRQLFALNPVEYIWGYWKHHELANLCAKNLGELNGHARRALRRMRRRPTLIGAFWKQAELFT